MLIDVIKTPKGREENNVRGENGEEIENQVEN